MSEVNLEIKTALQIQKNVHEVFEAIVDPVKMCNYFISKSSGRMVEGNQIFWKFPEFEEEVPIQVDKIRGDDYISYFWDIDSKRLLVEIFLSTVGNNFTLVTVTEKSMKNDEEGIKWLRGNTEGWANFLACLKAYLEYGINLRKGGFDYLRK